MTRAVRARRQTSDTTTAYYRGRPIRGWSARVFTYANGVKKAAVRGHFEIFVDIGDAAAPDWHKIGGALRFYREHVSYAWIGPTNLLHKSDITHYARAFVQGDQDLKATLAAMKTDARILAALARR